MCGSVNSLRISAQINMCKCKLHKNKCSKYSVRGVLIKELEKWGNKEERKNNLKAIPPPVKQALGRKKKKSGGKKPHCGRVDLLATVCWYECS